MAEGNSTSKRQRRLAAAIWVERYKIDNGCHRCGIRDPRVLEFHHIDRSSKKGNISDLVVRGFSLQAIQEEVGRCRLVCANCHRLLHIAVREKAKKAFVKRVVVVPVNGLPPVTKKRQPKLCRHKRSGRAYVTDPATGKEIYLGRWGSRKAEAEYQAWIHTSSTVPQATKAAVTVNVPERVRGEERYLLMEVYRTLCNASGKDDPELRAAIGSLELFWMRFQK